MLSPFGRINASLHSAGSAQKFIMTTTIQNQNFGIEIELTGITRAPAAKVISDYYGTSYTYIGIYYDTCGMGEAIKAFNCEKIEFFSILLK